MGRKSFTLSSLFSYRPSLSVAKLTSDLKFGSPADCIEFLTEANAVLDSAQTSLDCKLTAAVL